MNAKLPQASYRCGNFSDTSSSKLLKLKGWIRHAFAVYIPTKTHNQANFFPLVLREISVFSELALGHLRYHLTDVPPQPNSQPGGVSDLDWLRHEAWALTPESEPSGSPALRPVR